VTTRQLRVGVARDVRKRESVGLDERGTLIRSVVPMYRYVVDRFDEIRN